MNKLKRSHIFYVLKEKTPSPTTELIYKTPFELLISVILSAQATDISVNKATKRLFAVANTPEDIISLGLNNLKKHIKTIGLYNNKAKNIIDTCKTLVEKHNGKVPNTSESLENVSGVGSKTANVLLKTCTNM